MPSSSEADATYVFIARREYEIELLAIATIETSEKEMIAEATTISTNVNPVSFFAMRWYSDPALKGTSHSRARSRKR